MNKFSFLKIAAGVLLALLLVACSSTNQAYYNTLKLALEANEAQPVTLEQVTQSQADLLQVTIGDRPQALLALGYIENGLNKWVSADQAIIKIHDGVIVATEGFKQDLLYTSNLENNPLSDTGMVRFSWPRQVDIETIGYGLTVKSEWQAQQQEALTILGHTFETQKITETVSFPKTSPYLETQTQWQNTYWLNQDNGELLKASVKSMPMAERIEMVYLSRAARRIAPQESSQ
ncbi:YjbF family lipoprotein [Salinimonas marina]|uniref:YjbF family lipoprotein n=1 Tax=Salinimonas marina TaxID=2785918 RepID=A0A7S9DXC9_9ALTE|nr:YjbF family lipoprotein [Salinimonas marina]QPG05712.1 YjbF family lipoprotein [Salinimonas marina]